ncbi:MAG: hypothetical protein IKH54_02775 [Bacilli bacterium]|nr:hypothetical protein [Bacilli bacterium]
MNKKLLNKFSIGLSLDISIEEYKQIIYKYKDYIHSIYFSPPINSKFQSRKSIHEQFENKENVTKFYEILKLFRENNILLDCVLNRPSLSSEDIKENIKVVKDINPDIITCLKNHIDIVKDSFSNKEIIYSFNNNFEIGDLKNISKKFDTIVLGKYFLRSPKLIKKVYDSGFKIKLLVNNGCSYNCGGCKNGYENCIETFCKNLDYHTVNYLYALQSFYPYELDRLLDKVEVPIDTIKISNRTDGYEYLDKCLNSYINDLTEDIRFKKISDVRLYSRLSCFNKYFDELNSKEINSIKRRINNV